jgi:hypothetical protein
MDTVILPAYNKSEIARLYFLKKGENLTKQEAANRWRMIRQFDFKVLGSVFNEVHRKQMKNIRGEFAGTDPTNET